jgi:hypothetical protein
MKKIAEAVLYEGYLLYPYRRSARKNQQRWTFGVYPRAYSEARGEDDPWIMQTQCLVSGDEESAVEVKVRFLHVTERKVGEREARPSNSWRKYGSGRALPVMGRGDRARDSGRTVQTSELLESPMRVGIDIPGGSTEEPLTDSTGEVVGRWCSWRTVCGTVEVEAEPLQEGPSG